MADLIVKCYDCGNRIQAPEQFERDTGRPYILHGCPTIHQIVKLIPPPEATAVHPSAEENTPS